MGPPTPQYPSTSQSVMDLLSHTPWVGADGAQWGTETQICTGIKYLKVQRHTSWGSKLQPGTSPASGALVNPKRRLSDP